MKEIKFLIKFIILPVCLIIAFNFLEYGLIWDKIYKFLYPILLTAIFITNMQFPKFRPLSMALAYAMLVLMIFLYLVDQLNLSNIIGSSGIAILIITLFTYLPQIIKKGFVEKF